MSTALVPIKEQLLMADALVKSNRFPGEKNAYEALAKIQAGYELGLAPVQSLMNIHMVQGRVTLGAGLIAAKIKGSGKYNYKIIEQTNERVTLEFFEKWNGKDFESVGGVSFSMEDAKTAGLLSKDVWKKYPSDMLFARCLTRGARRFCPDVFGGPVYTKEELEDPNIIEGSFEDVTQKSSMSWEDFLVQCKERFGLEEGEVKSQLKANEITSYVPTEYEKYFAILNNKE